MNYLYRFRSFKFHFNIWPKIENNFFLNLQGYLNSWFTVYRKKIGNFEDFEKKGQLLTKTRFFFSRMKLLVQLWNVYKMRRPSTWHENERKPCCINKKSSKQTNKHHKSWWMSCLKLIKHRTLCDVW